MTGWTDDDEVRVHPVTPDPREDAPQPPPPALRFMAAIAYLGDPTYGPNYPARILRDCAAHWRSWEAQERGRAAPPGIASYAVAAYCLGRRDGTDAGMAVANDLLAERAAGDDATRGQRAAALLVAGCYGFGLAVALFLVGYVLGR